MHQHHGTRVAPGPEVRALAAPASRLERLTSLRFLFAAYVFLRHAAEDLPLPLLERLTSVAYTGVGFFFVLSGFVLAYSTRKDLPRRAFFRRRTARIYPMHVVTWVLAVLGATTSDVPPSATAIILTLLLLQSWHPANDVHYGLNGVTWSLSCEVFFYTLFPWLRPLTDNTRRCIAIIVSGIVLAVAVSLMFPDPLDKRALLVLPLARLPEFLLGMLMGVAFREGRHVVDIGMPAATAITLCSLAVATALDPVDHLLGGLLLIPAFVLLVAAAAAADARGVRGWLVHPWTVALGDASFAFYLVHQLVNKALRRAELIPEAGTSTAVLTAYVLGMFAVSLALAFTLHRLVERPAYRRLSGTRRT